MSYRRKTVFTAPDFAAGKTYVYKYEAFLLGGLPEEGLAKAGVKVSSKVLISAAAQNIYMLKVRNMEQATSFSKLDQCEMPSDKSYFCAVACGT